jgi:N-acetylglucosaminyldiphosphoundecaprenol N-acetyl-beta-D-mannosaminyltransferase
MSRVYGPDLMLAMMEATRDGSFTHYFYGGREGVADELAAAMRQRFPGVRIAGFGTPPYRPLTEEEAARLAEEFRQGQVRFIWIGISTPKQDYLMDQLLRHYPEGIFFGVGAAFDFHTGRVRQAPSWMQQAGLEWFFRLTQEPRRLWRRYMISNPRFLFHLFLQTLGLRSYPG